MHQIYGAHLTDNKPTDTLLESTQVDLFNKVSHNDYVQRSKNIIFCKIAITLLILADCFKTSHALYSTAINVSITNIHCIVTNELCSVVKDYLKAT